MAGASACHTEQRHSFEGVGTTEYYMRSISDCPYTRGAWWARLTSYCFGRRYYPRNEKAAMEEKELDAERRIVEVFLNAMCRVDCSATTALLGLLVRAA